MVKSLRSKTSGYGAAAIAVAAMISVQSGAAVSTWMFPAMGPLGTAFCRLAFAACILVIWTRPSLRGRGWQDLLVVMVLGAVSAGMTLFYFQAISRIPLGVASSLEFLGPLVVSLAALRRGIDAVWPLSAVAGVLALTQPWTGSINFLGLCFGLMAGACLGGYVIFLQQVGDRFTGVEGLAMSMVVAALCATPFGLPQALPGLTAGNLEGAAAAAVLLPILPYMLEMLALRKLTAAAFSTLLSFEPAVGTLIGFLLLEQRLSLLQIFGISCVIMASLAAIRHGKRDNRSRIVEDPADVTVAAA